MAYIQPKNWTDFQHYKDRSPSWIKLHKSILDNYEYQCLPIASKALAPMLWLLASEYEDGKIPADLNRIAFRIRISVADLEDALSHLITSGFFIGYQDASTPLAICLPREEIEKSKSREREEGSSPDGDSPKKSSSKATRLATDWQPDEVLMAWAKSERPDLNLKLTVETFRDYWCARAGKDATKADWSATFRNWVRREKAQAMPAKPVDSWAGRDI